MLGLADWSFTLMGLGYGLSCLGGVPAAPPSVAPAGPFSVWPMSQRTGRISDLAFASGFALPVYAACDAACGRGGLRGGLFRTFDCNALAAYTLHDLVAGAVTPNIPRDAPGWYVAVGFLLYFRISYGLVRGPEKQELFVKL